MNVLRPVGSTLSPKPAKPESQMMYRVDLDFAESTSRLVNRWGTLCTNMIAALVMTGHHHRFLAITWSSLERKSRTPP